MCSSIQVTVQKNNRTASIPVSESFEQFTEDVCGLVRKSAEDMLESYRIINAKDFSDIFNNPTYQLACQQSTDDVLQILLVEERSEPQQQGTAEAEEAKAEEVLKVMAQITADGKYILTEHYAPFAGTGWYKWMISGEDYESNIGTAFDCCNKVYCDSTCHDKFEDHEAQMASYVWNYCLNSGQEWRKQCPVNKCDYAYFR